MKAFVTSIGEPTTDLCVWSLQRQGFDVELVQSNSTLWDKLNYIYHVADDTFLRVDADVIVNRNAAQLVFLDEDTWWVQGMCYGWYSQDVIYGGVQLYGKQLLPILRRNLEAARALERPETYMSRLPELHNPRRFVSSDLVCGLHGFRQDDYDRVIATKTKRRQLDNYDFELAKRLDSL